MVIDQYKLAHKEPYFCRGTAIKGYVEEIKEIIEETNSKTLLDYGCGKGQQYSIAKIHEYWGVPRPYLYDPGVENLDIKPKGRFDGVICTDVLEHVENPEAVIRELFWYAQKFVYMTISIQHSPVHKKLPDGTPLHISVHPKEWWLERMPKTDVKTVIHFDVGELPRKPFFNLVK